MAKPPKSSSPSRSPKQPKGEALERYRDRNLVPVNPMKEQFEPTEAEPVRQHARMAGC